MLDFLHLKLFFILILGLEVLILASYKLGALLVLHGRRRDNVPCFIWLILIVSHFLLWPNQLSIQLLGLLMLLELKLIQAQNITIFDLPSSSWYLLIPRILPSKPCQLMFCHTHYLLSLAQTLLLFI